MKQKTVVQDVGDSQIRGRLKTYAQDVKNVLKEQLGVTDEQIETAMEALGMTVVDFMNPSQLAGLVSELTGCEETAELLCNEDFQQILSGALELTDEMLSELGVTRQELEQALTMMQPNGNADADKVETVDLPENQGTVLPENASQPGDIQSVVPADKDTVNVENVVAQEAPEEHLQQEIMQPATPKQQTDDKNATQQEQLQENDMLPEKDVPELLKKENLPANGSQTQNHSADQNHTQAQNGPIVAEQNLTDVSTAATGHTVPTYTGQIDLEGLMRQIAEAARVTVASSETTMEMQLNPEHLGKIYLEITSKQGVVSAHIMAQNEIVKEALESQMAELRQNMNQAGVKIDAVEVTVGSHEFERNLEQNAQQEEKQAEDQEKASGKMRKINLADLDELSGVMSEEESLVAQIMADNGNTVDFTA